MLIERLSYDQAGIVTEAKDNGQFEILWDSKTPVAPITWNQYVPETKGYACDWTLDRPDAGKYKM